MENKPELVHFQITRNCNLRCYFCGQWGKQGFFSDAAGKDMTLDDWKEVALELKQNYDPLPHIILWGGEPLVCPFFDELVIYLKSLGFTLGMVTNGVLLDEHMECCKTHFKTIYISIDGTREIHNQIRGNGVYEKVSENLKELSDSDVHIIVMSVLSPMLVENIEGFPEVIASLGADELYLQNYIRLTTEEAEEYKKWMLDSFGIKASEIDSWISDLPDDYEIKKQRAIDEVKKGKFNIPVSCLPHNMSDRLCCSPNKHIHISWNGNVMFCTDFYDFSAGNVKEQGITEIFNNEISQKFRDELQKNPTCKHCSWRNNEHFWL